MHGIHGIKKPYFITLTERYMYLWNGNPFTQTLKRSGTRCQRCILSNSDTNVQHQGLFNSQSPSTKDKENDA
jgi:hypothetical protein